MRLGPLGMLGDARCPATPAAQARQRASLVSAQPDGHYSHSLGGDAEYNTRHHLFSALASSAVGESPRERGGTMHISEIENAVIAGLADADLKARIVNEGPVALSDILAEREAREAATTLTGRVTELESELKVQRATNGWI